MIEGKGNERFLKNRDDRFWQLVRERPQAGAKAGAENKRLSNKRARSRGQSGALYRIDFDPHAQNANSTDTAEPVPIAGRALATQMLNRFKARLAVLGEGREHSRCRARPRW